MTPQSLSALQQAADGLGTPIINWVWAETSPGSGVYTLIPSPSVLMATDVDTDDPTAITATDGSLNVYVTSQPSYEDPEAGVAYFAQGVTPVTITSTASIQAYLGPCIYYGVACLTVTTGQILNVWDNTAATGQQIDYIAAAGIATGLKQLLGGGLGIICQNGVFLSWGTPPTAPVINIIIRPLVVIP